MIQQITPIVFFSNGVIIGLNGLFYDPYRNEIALEVRVKGQYYFSRIKITGMPPKEYRRKRIH
jgi:uncharacterized Fe-S cluster-containing radical SAM superfamily protein